MRAHIDLTASSDEDHSEPPPQPPRRLQVMSIVDLTGDDVERVSSRPLSGASGKESAARRLPQQTTGLPERDQSTGDFRFPSLPSHAFTTPEAPQKRVEESASSRAALITSGPVFNGNASLGISSRATDAQTILEPSSRLDEMGSLDVTVNNGVPLLKDLTHGRSLPESFQDDEKQSDKVALLMPDFEDVLKKHIRSLREDHEYFMKGRLARARRAYDKALPSRYTQFTSPFAVMNILSSNSTSMTSSAMMEVGKLHQQVVKSIKPGVEKLAVPCVTYAIDNATIPPYESYISTHRNVLVEDELHRTFIPYYGDDTWIEPDYAEMETRIDRNKEKYHYLNVVCEKAECYGPYAERFLEEVGCDFDDVLHYLLNDTNPAVPEELPSPMGPIWLNREAHVKEDYYQDSEESDSSQPRRKSSTMKVKKPLRQWRTVFESLPESLGSRGAAAAGLACAAFLKVTGFSLWHIAKRQKKVLDIISGELRLDEYENHLPSVQSSATKLREEPGWLSTYTNLGCLVCFAHECPGHGEYCDEDDTKNVRLRVNTKPLSPTSLTGPASRKDGKGGRQTISSLAINMLAGMGNDGTITDSTPSKEDGFREDELCSDLCFWKKSNRSRSVSRWSPDKIDLLETLLPAYFGLKRAACLLVTAIDKPCAEIFLKICESPLPSIPVNAKLRSQSSTLSFRPAPKRGFDYWHQNSKTWQHDQRPPFKPCNHSGPCSAATDCSCYNDEVTCEKSCMCAENCARRYQGCSCAARGKVCWGNERCDCYRLDRECDPDLCRNCGAHDVLDPVNRYKEDIAKGKCTNVYVQKGVPRRTLLGHSILLASGNVSGWGLYMGEPVKAGEYLGEYVGEIVSKEEGERRGLIYNKRNLSYLFALNKTQVLDSTRIGNKFRYINHQAPPYANCRAKILLCNTVHRIGMFAERNLEIGDELLFDYGEEFTSRFDLIKLDGRAEPKVERRKGNSHLGSVSTGKTAMAKKTGVGPGRPRKTVQLDQLFKSPRGVLDTDEETPGSESRGAIRKPRKMGGKKRKRTDFDVPVDMVLDEGDDALLSEGDIDSTGSSSVSYHSSDEEEEVEVRKPKVRSGEEFDNPQKRGWVTRKANLAKKKVGRRGRPSAP